MKANDRISVLIHQLMSTGAQACVVAYSLVDRASFEAVENWKRKVTLYAFCSKINVTSFNWI